MLLPAAPQDWLPPGHLAYFIGDTIDALDLKAFYARYQGGGSRKEGVKFTPRMVAKVSGIGFKVSPEEEQMRAISASEDTT